MVFLETKIFCEALIGEGAVVALGPLGFHLAAISIEVCQLEHYLLYEGGIGLVLGEEKEVRFYF